MRTPFLIDKNYWLSGIKKNGEDRHWAGSWKIKIDRKIVGDYLKITGQQGIDPKRLEVVEIAADYPVERINSLENKRVEED